MPAWRWMAGMRYRWKNGYTYRITDEDVLCENKFAEECEPDWDDPATMGCLLAQVREKQGKSCTSYRDGRGWCVMRLLDPESSVAITPDYRTEVEALLAALEG